MYLIFFFPIMLLAMIFMILGTLSIISMKTTLIEILILNFNPYMDLNLTFLFDWMSCYFMFIVLFISSLVYMYSKKYMESDKNNKTFGFLILMFIISMILLILMPNAISMLIGWDGLGLSSYCLVIFYSNENSNSAGMITIMTNRLGDSALVLFICLLIIDNNFSLFYLNITDKKIFLTMLLFMMATMTKSAQIPFSAWLPAAMAAPTPVSSLVHSSTLVTAGIYLMIRVKNCMNLLPLSNLLFYLSIMTMILAGLSAMMETDLKKIIALSTLSQLGVMMMILALKLNNLAFFHLMTHAMFKALLFLCAGVIIHGSNNCQDIRYMSNMWFISPSISMNILLASMALMGFPFLSGFFSKDMILETIYFFNNNYLIMIYIFMGTIFTTAYSFRMIFYMNIKTPIKQNFCNFQNNMLMNFPIYALSICSIFMGCLFSWLIFSHPQLIHLTSMIKLINLFILSGGIITGIYLCTQINPSNNKMMFFPLFKLMFLHFISTSSVLKSQNTLYTFFKLDQEWIETLSASGSMSEILKYNTNFTHMQLSGFKYILIILISMQFMFML